MSIFYSKKAAELLEPIDELLEKVYELVLDRLPDSRSRSIAITQLQTAQLWMIRCAHEGEK